MAFDINLRLFFPDLGTKLDRFLSTQLELKEMMMTAREDFQREIKESKAQASTVVAALNTLRAAVAEMQAKLDAAANGLTAEEVAAASAELDSAQQEVASGLAAGNVQVPADPAAPVVVADPATPSV